MTCQGAGSNSGSIFRMNADGTGFKVLHSFSGTDGACPHGSLTLSGKTLYGMTSAGGQSDNGAIFSINTNGSAFRIIHSFAGDDKGTPDGSLALSGKTLYGMTSVSDYLSESDNGTIFKIQINGTGLAVLHDFASADGKYPRGSLLLSGSTVYGMTGDGGSSDKGTIFSAAIPTPSQ